MPDDVTRFDEMTNEATLATPGMGALRLLLHAMIRELEAIDAQFRSQARGRTEVDFLFDRGPGPYALPGFIDTLLLNGQGCGVGKWIERDDGKWALRVWVHDEDIRRQP